MTRIFNLGEAEVLYNLLINTTMHCFPHLTSIVFFSIALILYRFQKNEFDVKHGKLSIETFIKRVYRGMLTFHQGW